MSTPPGNMDSTLLVFPFSKDGIKDQEREAVMRLVLRQKDGMLLAEILGLTGEPEPLKRKGGEFNGNERKEWCSKHAIPRVQKGKDARRTVCRKCATEYDTARRARLRMEAMKGVDS